VSTKHEWRKKEKELYLPKGKPELVEVPKFNFIKQFKVKEALLKSPLQSV